MNFSISNLQLFKNSLWELPDSKLLINTINAHSYNLAQHDKIFANALLKSDVLLPDGISIVFAIRFLNGEKLKKIAGADLFHFEMERLNICGGSCMFLGSNETTLNLISERAMREYPNVKVFLFSPPYKPEFSDEDNERMLAAVNNCRPEVLFLGMTAPKQEKWAYQNFDKLNVGHICCIGAVFDFYSMRIKRAPDSFIKFGLEWFYRFAQEPGRMWRRYFLGNTKFIWLVLKESFKHHTR